MINVAKEINKIFENALHKSKPKITQLPDDQFDGKNYLVDIDELYGYATVPQVVNITKGEYTCYGSDCQKFKKSHIGFVCKHIRVLKKVLAIS